MFSNSTYLSICLFIYLLIYLFILFIYLFIYLYIYLFIYLLKHCFVCKKRLQLFLLFSCLEGQTKACLQTLLHIYFSNVILCYFYSLIKKIMPKNIHRVWQLPSNRCTLHIRVPKFWRRWRMWTNTKKHISGVIPFT